MVGVDTTTESDAALRWAALEAALTGAELSIVHAWSVAGTSWTAALAAVHDEESEVEGAAERLVERCRRTARRLVGGAGTIISTRIVEGRPTEVLVDQARGTGLLVVGHRDRGVLERTVMGSVATACVRHASVPVVVVGHGAADPGSGTVVVGVDGDDDAVPVLHWAFEEAYRVGGTLHVAHAWHIPAGPLVGPGGVTGIAAPPLGRSRADVLDWVERHRLPRHASVPVTVASAPGPATQLLIAEAEGASVLVVGSRGRGALLGTLLGSVGRRCLERAACAVVVVPDPGREEADR